MAEQKAKCALMHIWLKRPRERLSPMSKAMTQTQIKELAKMLVVMIFDLHNCPSQDPDTVYVQRAMFLNNIGVTKDGKYKLIRSEIEIVPKRTEYTKYKIPADEYNAYNMKKLLSLVIMRQMSQTGGSIGIPEPTADDDVRDAIEDTANVIKRVVEESPLPVRMKNYILSRSPTPSAKPSLFASLTKLIPSQRPVPSVTT